MSNPGDVITGALQDEANKMTKVSVKAVGIQVALMAGISLAVTLAFSFFRPREKKVYAPKVKYREADDEAAPPPTIKNGFFSWLSPLVTSRDMTLVDTIGVDAVAFLQFLSLLRWTFLAVTLISCGILIPINVIYTLKSNATHDALSMLTISGLNKSKILYVHMAMSYIISGVVMFFTWFYWKKMLVLRKRWFLSAKFQRGISSRSLMITNVKKEYQSDEGLKELMMKIRGGNEKISAGIQASMIGRDLKDYPELVEDYNETVKEFEEVLVKYLKGGHEKKQRPRISRGGFMGIGATKIDAIEFYANKLTRLRNVLDSKKEDIDLLRPKMHKNHSAPKLNKDGSYMAAKNEKKIKTKIPSESYGFISMMDAAQAHAIARSHKGRQKELHGAEIILAPAPVDIIWHNAKITPAERANSRFFGMCMLAIVCFLNTIPLIIVAAAANLTVLSNFVPFLGKWESAGAVGNWTFSTVAGVLPPAISGIFGLLLPYIIRKLTKYQGLLSRSQVDRTVLTRYYAFLVISQFFVFSLLSVALNLVTRIIGQVKKHEGASAILKGFDDLPDQIQQAYVKQSTYWLLFLPMRGFLVFFELAQLIKLCLLSFKTLIFAKTPRDIMEWTKPPAFQYPVVYANLLFLAAIGLIYAPLAPLVTLFTMVVFWLSHFIYKYQLLYVYVSRVESGGRMWNVAINRLLVSLMLMQALVILTITLQRRSWQDAVASAPPFLVTIAFKIFVLRPYANAFAYFSPTPEEAQSVVGDAKYSYKQRFTHPALRSDVLYTVLVHKEQQDLVRDLLSSYSSKLQKDVKGVREAELTDYDPAKDPARHEDMLLTTEGARSLNGSQWGGSTVGGDNASEFGVPPYQLQRTNSGQSSVLGRSYSPGPGQEESTVDLIHSAAPPAQGWYAQQRGHEPQHSQQGYDGYYDQSSQRGPPPTSLNHMPLLPRSDSQGQESYPMNDLPPSRRASPGPFESLRSPGGYGTVPADDGADMADNYYQPRTQGGGQGRI